MIVSRSGDRTRSWRWRAGKSKAKPRYDWSKKKRRLGGWIA